VTVLSRDLDFHDNEYSWGIVPVKGTVEREPPDELRNRNVIVISGQWKNFRGIIKDTNRIRGTARVELAAGSILRTIKLSQLADIE
jgi:transcription elongation factor